LREHVGFKLEALLRGRQAAHGDVRELLFGDDWESDPFTYSLYADVLDGTLGDERLASVLTRVGVDPALRPEIHALAAEVAGRGGVDRIFINLERRTPPAVFRLYGGRIVPTFNYFQTTLVLAAEGWIDGEDLVRVARSLVERSGFTPRRLENSLADLVRRSLVPPATARRLAEPLRDGALLPRPAHPRLAWVGRALDRLGRGRPAPPTLPARAMPLDYEAILGRLRAARTSS
jgi:hypothetical protein